MDADAMIRRIEAGAGMLRGVAGAASEEDSARRPADGGWCLREVLGHLLREEREDFRPRIAAVLAGPDAPWPPLDPERSVREGGFRERDAASILAEFLDERRRSLAWLRGLAAPDWGLFRDHPRAGRLRAGDLLAAWADHDCLHARQMVRILHGMVKEDAAPYAVDYAGSW